MQTASGSILMNAIGADIWDAADQFRFAYKTLTGNGTMIARVNSIYNSNAWAKGGVMIRQSIEAGSTHAFMPITPGRTATAPASSGGWPPAASPRPTTTAPAPSWRLRTG